MEIAPLKIENLKKSYGSFEAVKGVSFEMKPGEIFGLLGPNGAGKTSIISTIVTLEQATAGKVLLFGSEVGHRNKLAKSLVGLVPQEIVNHGFFSIEEVLNIHSGYYGRKKNGERVEYLLKRLSLWDSRHKKVLQLSGGMKRRFMIAKALVHEPKLLLLDEPTAGVDIELRNSLWEFVRELNKNGTSILLTTHYLEEAEKLCDRVAIIDKGLILKVGQTHDLVKGLTHREIVIHLKSGLAAVQSPYLKRQTSEALVFHTPSQLGLGDLLIQLKLDQSLITDIKIKEGNLEEAFLNIIHHKDKEPLAL